MVKKLDGFRFKQFSIEHSQCAMKVGTDGILLGSWVEPIETHQRILDIGTGSGLLAIMLAQKSTRQTQIIGIDIDSSAVNQATQNMLNSPWRHQLSCQQIDVKDMVSDRCFDLIISNPPYFPSHPQTSTKRNASIQDPARRSARHNAELQLDELFCAANRLLTDNGHFYCILPSDINRVMQISSTNNLHCDKLMHVHAAADKPAIRQLMRFTKKPTSTETTKLCIHHSSAQYSPAYKKLCADYYLNF